jgi:hypothetical protein
LHELEPPVERSATSLVVSESPAVPSPLRVHVMLVYVVCKRSPLESMVSGQVTAAWSDAVSPETARVYEQPEPSVVAMFEPDAVKVTTPPGATETVPSRLGSLQVREPDPVSCQVPTKAEAPVPPPPDDPLDPEPVWHWDWQFAFPQLKSAVVAGSSTDVKQLWQVEELQLAQVVVKAVSHVESD